MDITETLAPKSDQQNYDDYISGAKTLTITEARVVGGEQPVELHLAEFPGRPYKPGKSMRRVIAKAWGSESSAYTGRRLTLYGDPDISFGGKKVGGIRISHMSHIDSAFTMPLTVTRGKKAGFTVQPLPDAPAPVDNVAEWITALNTAQSIGDLQGAWEKAAAAGVTNRPDVIAAKDARKKELA
jgi:hypothetical protein